MESFSTWKLESILGAILVVLVAGFFVTKIFAVLSDFNTEVEIQTNDQVVVKGIPETERKLIEAWVHDNNIEVPPGKGYRYLIQTYPDKPWLNQ